MDGVTSLIREKWQPACFAGNLKSIRYKRALTPALITFKLVIGEQNNKDKTIRSFI